MDRAVADADSAKRISKAHALLYRDGLAIALLALIPMRSRTLVALRIGKQLVKTGNLWALDIPATDTKTRRPLDYPVAEELCRRIDLYLERFRRRIPGADTHTALWASNKRRPMSTMKRRVRRTKAKSSLKRARTKSKTKKTTRAKRSGTKKKTTRAKRSGTAKKALLPKVGRVAKKAALAAGVAAIGTALSELKPEQTPDQQGREQRESKRGDS